MAKAKAADFNRSEVIRAALTALKNPNAPVKEVAEWIIKKHPTYKKQIDALGDQFSGYVSGQRSKVADALGMEYVNKRGKNASKAKPASATVDILEVVELIENEFDGDPDKLLSAIRVVGQWDVGQLKSAVTTWGEMLEAAKGDAKLAKNMLEIVGRRG